MFKLSFFSFHSITMQKYVLLFNYLFYLFKKQIIIYNENRRKEVFVQHKDGKQ